MELTLNRSYVEERHGGLWIAGTRVSLDSIVYAYRQGLSPEEIRDRFPAVTLEQVYGAITFYLARKEEVDPYLQQGEEEAESLRRQLRGENGSLHDKVKAAREGRSAL